MGRGPSHNSEYFYLAYTRRIIDEGGSWMVMMVARGQMGIGWVRCGRGSRWWGSSRDEGSPRDADGRRCMIDVS